MSHFNNAVVLLALGAAISIVYYTLKNGIPPMPTTRYLCKQTEILLARFGPETGTVIEAGSGWGTLALYLNKRFLQYQFLGLENSLIPIWFAKVTRLILRRKQCSFRIQDMYSFEYQSANVVICYLFSKAMQNLSVKFREQLPEDALIISIFFALPGWEPLHVEQCNDLYRTKIYVYRVKK